MKSGIYKITNLANGNFYVGSAVYIKNRISSHKSLLNKFSHFNHHLQNAWNLFGEECFIFEVVEYCEKEKLIEREQYWIDILKPKYNLAPTAGNNLGLKYSEKSKRKMSAWQIGRKMSDEAKINMRLARRAVSKWKCDDGILCKCNNCLPLMREYKKNKAREYRARTN